MRNSLIILIISLIPLLTILLMSDFPHTHDGLVHLARMGSYYKALSDGQFPVRWAGDLNYGYGMPLFIFIYQLPYLISSFFVYVGFSLASSFKITLGLSYIISGFFMYLFSKQLLRDEKKAFFVTILYQFAPFRFVELFIRGSFGEVYSYTFLPLTLYGLISLIHKNSYRNFMITAIGGMLLILAHNALSLVFFAVCMHFSIFFTKKRSDYFVTFSALTIALMLAAFYWVPALLEHKYTHGDLFMKNVYQSHFSPLQNFFIPNFTNDKRLQIEGITVYLGLFHTIGIILSIILWIKKRTVHKLMVFGFLLFVVSIFFMLPISAFVWKNISLLRQFQFPWRFLALSVFSTSILSVSFFSFGFLKNRIAYWMVIFLVIVSTVYYWKPLLGVDKINEQYYWNYPLNSTYYGETDVIWSAGPANAYPKYPVEIIDGNAKVANYKRNSFRHVYNITSITNSRVVDHTQYFPGWRVLLDGKQIPIQFQDPNWRGQLIYAIPKGKHVVQAVFKESPVRYVANIISVITASFLIIGFIFKKKYAAL